MRFLTTALLATSVLTLASCSHLPKLSFGKKESGSETDKDRTKRETAEGAFLEECKKLGNSGGSVAGVDGWYFSGAELKQLGATPEVGSTAFASAVNSISEYRRQLKQNGVDLLLVVVPPKALVFPEKVSKDAKVPLKKGTPPMLSSYTTSALSALEKKGVKVLDLTATFLSQRTAKAGALFAKGSTHPTPHAAEITAHAIAGEVSLSHGGTGYVVQEATLQGGNELGGKAEKLPVRKVFRADGTSSIPLGETGLPVLILADDAVRQWRTENASLPEQLSYEMQLPLGILTAPNARNAQRLKLMRMGTTGKNPFASTKLLIWIINSNELNSTDWDAVPLKLEFKMADPTLRLQ